MDVKLEIEKVKVESVYSYHFNDFLQDHKIDYEIRLKIWEEQYLTKNMTPDDKLWNFCVSGINLQNKFEDIFYMGKVD